MEWTEERRACPLCGGCKHSLVGFRGGDAHRSGLGVRATVVRCRSCHAVYCHPALLPQSNPYDMHSADEYFQAHDDAGKVASGVDLARRASTLLSRSGRMLELGCGSGAVLEGARRAGWVVQGVEMTPAFVAKARARGMDVEATSIESCRSLDQGWDCVLLAAVLEHLYDPVTCLRRVFAALVPGGLAFIDVPNECSLWTRIGNLYMRLRGRDWAVNLSPTFPPYHVVGFCPRSLAGVVKRIGFEVVELRTWRWQNELPPPKSLVARLERQGMDAALSLGACIGSGAGMTAWIRRPLRD